MAYWWVNQSRTYRAERDAGILWAPKATAAGRSLGHWAAMTEIQPGDVIFHYARGAIRALGSAQSTASTAERPYDLPDVWGSDGWGVVVTYFDVSQPIGRDEIPLEWRRDSGEVPFDRNGDVKQGYLFPVSRAFAAELFDDFADRWPDAPRLGLARTPPIEHDARKVLARLIGQPLATLSGRPNRILKVDEAHVMVVTERSPEGQPVPLVEVQRALDLLISDGEVLITPEVIGYRSAFVGAVLRTLPGATVHLDPARVQLQPAAEDLDAVTIRQRRRDHDDDLLTEQLLAAIARLRRWTRDGVSAVHKPLLLLLALERLHRGLPRLVAFTELEDQLRGLISEFSPTPGGAHPEYPFWRLRRDGVWEVVGVAGSPAEADMTDPPLSVLRASEVKGGLLTGFDTLLRARGEVLDQAVGAVLGYFAPELRARVLASVGWDDAPPQSPHGPAGAQPGRIGVPYQERDATVPAAPPAAYQVDPDKVGRGVQAHEATLRALVSALRAQGIAPLQHDGGIPRYDLAWETDTAIFVAEVKSLTLTNAEHQLRLGLGQVLRYWHAMTLSDKPVVAVLAVEQRPADDAWPALCKRLAVHLMWPDCMPAAIARLCADSTAAPMRPPLRWRFQPDSPLEAWTAKSGQDGAFYVCQVHVKKNGTVRWTITGGGGTKLDSGIAPDLDAAKTAVEQCLDGLYALNA
jgi:hypothetical protein